MEVNELKSSLMVYNIVLGQYNAINAIKAILPLKETKFHMGLKYLGFYLKVNEYGFMDWW